MRGTIGGTRRLALASALLLVCMTSACTAAIHPRAAASPAESRNGNAAEAAPLPSDNEPTGSISSVNALAVAEQAAERFCSPTSTRSEWMAALDPFLTMAAADAYGTVNPSRVSCARVTGAPRSGAGDGYTQLVMVSTDAGPYQVTLTRYSSSDRWLVYRITPVSAR